jgi:hypothetical protein
MMGHEPTSIRRTCSAAHFDPVWSRNGAIRVTLNTLIGCRPPLHNGQHIAVFSNVTINRWKWWNLRIPSAYSEWRSDRKTVRSIVQNERMSVFWERFQFRSVNAPLRGFKIPEGI